MMRVVRRALYGSLVARMDLPKAVAPKKLVRLFIEVPAYEISPVNSTAPSLGQEPFD